MDKIIETLNNNRKGKIVGVCVGSWDIVHVGHIRFLLKLKDECDILVVGIRNNEIYEQTHAMKPFTSQELRQEVLNSIKPVDYTFIADDRIGYSFAKDLIPDKYFYSYKTTITPAEEKEISLLTTTCKKVQKIKYAKPNISTRSLFKEIIRHELEFMFD